MKKRYVFWGLAVILIISLIAVNQNKLIYADSTKKNLEVLKEDIVDISYLNEQNRLKVLECELFEQKMDLAIKEINLARQNGQITATQAQTEFDYIQNLRNNFDKGILPREMNPNYKSGVNEEYRRYDGYGTYGIGHGNHHNEYYNYNLTPVETNTKRNYKPSTSAPVNTNTYRGHHGRNHHGGNHGANCRHY